MKIVAFSNQKGGVGKSTTSFNVAHLLAEDSRVLMVDLDPQGSLTAICGKDGDVEYTVYDLLKKQAKFEQVRICVNEALDLLPANQELADLEIQIIKEKGREQYLKKALSNLPVEYDYIIIDCPPSLNLLLVNALVSASDVLIPCETDYLSFKGVDLLLNTIASIKTSVNPGLKILGLIATFHDGRTLHNREIYEMLDEIDIPIITAVSRSIKVKDAVVGSVPLHQYDKNNKIVGQYIKIKEAILNG